MSAVVERDQRMAFERSNTGLNVSPERIREHVAANIQRPLPQVRACPIRRQRMIVAAGGPSLADRFEILRFQVEKGGKLCTVNGTHHYCVERGLTPDVHVMLDARPFNVRFIDPPQAKTLYCLASQCHPAVFDRLAHNKLAIWHCDSGNGEREIIEKYYQGNWAYIEGGCSVGLRAIMLCRRLGFDQLDLYGFDSCVRGDQHHAYQQVENDTTPTSEKVVVGGKEFYCHGWMKDQAVDFMEMMKHRAGMFKDIHVWGDGLIAALMRAGAERVEGSADDGREHDQCQTDAA